MGGEKLGRMAVAISVIGSPPHGRGKAPFKRGLFHILGITPAWAGKSQLLPCCGLWSLDHPRVGGEKSWWGDEVTPKQGSPPRGRGKDFMFCGQHLEIRITPAWAGKSKLALCTPSCPTDHPRVGGEKMLAFPYLRL